MKTHRPARRAIIATGALLGAAALFNADAAFAQAKGADTFPSRPVRMIVPFAPGGPTDIVARLLAQRLGEIWGQTVLIDNRPGAGGNLGVEIAAKAAPDGYTILVTSSSYLVNPALYEKLRWDPFKSFVPVTNAATSPNLFVVHPSVPAKSMKELIALIKSQPGKFSYASPGLGTTPQLSCEMFKALTGVDVQHVPYGGAGPATTSVVGNQNPMGCMAQPPAVPHVQAGKLRALAITSAKRASSLPDVPTMLEQGFANFVTDNMNGVFLPAGASPALVNRLHADILKALANPDLRERLQSQGLEPVGDTPQAFAAYVKQQIGQWTKVVKDAGIKVE
ncbi:MAG: tripartite tricarboxylate transporter substrate binding protein [Burkholderiales bacterium]|nr:tripartite tricarboxylate transporter substrate binding protein [Burkholderiales bacterium]